MDDLDLNAVTAFVRVAEERSFRGAAKALGASKSTVSQRISQLEERLGARLFDRTTRSVRLTDVGESYYKAVAPALASLRAAESLVEDLGGRPRGRLRLTAPLELGQCVMGDALAWFAERFPEVEVWADLTDRHVNLVEEGFDLALRVGPLSDSALVARRVSEPQTKRLYASPDYLARCGTPTRPAELSDHDCLVMSGAKEATTWALHGPDGPEAIAIRPRIAVNSWMVVRDLAIAGRGIARLPELNAREALAEDQLVEVLADFAPPPSACYAVYPSARNQSPSVRAMIEVLVERLNASSCRL